MMREAMQEGKTGEEIASQLLTERGFVILERNFRSPVGEVDIIAKHLKNLHFIEVKLRGEGSLGSAAESVLPHQQKRIRRAAEWYLMNKREWRYNAPPVSFGVVAIDHHGDAYDVEFFEDAF